MIYTDWVRYFKIGICGLALMIIIACATAPPSGKIIVQPDTVYMGAAGWVINQIEGQSWGMPVHPTADGSGWLFILKPGAEVHYIQVPYNALKQHQILTFTYRATGKFVSVQDGGQATCRPMIRRQGDQMTVNQEFYRWWSGPPVKLIGDGQIHTVTYVLQWSNWTGVFGKSNQSEFAYTMNGHIMTVALTFGGASDAGHGASVDGKFELLGYQIQ